MNILEVQGLTKKYGDFAAVSDIDFSVRKGEVFGFLGPNGAGKTTTINMLTGLARPTEGSISLAGIDCVMRVKEAQGLMGIVPDESNLYPEMSGFENLNFCGALYGMEKEKRLSRAWELLREVGLDDVAQKRFGAYSRGMKRKLTIAAGIIHNPDILFLDEPTTGIDVESARHIRRLLVDLNKSGTTIFLTTHYIEEAERLCDRIAFIVKGKIVKTDFTEQLVKAAEKEKIVEFAVGDGALDPQKMLRQAFPNYRYKKLDEHTIRVYSSEPVDLIPIMEVFKQNHLTMYEAKIIRPSLEEVFVQVTGIEAKEMRGQAKK